ncbi:MAG: phospholipase D-like domain-containing protein, partial [Candidatus Dormibacteraceae bacterium]
MLAVAVAATACAPPGSRATRAPGAPPVSAPPVTPQVSLLERTGDLPIQEFVAGAQRTLDCEIYEVTSQSLADALGSAAARGVRVRVILEPQAWSTLTVQRESGVQVLPTPHVDLDHTKSCVRDAGTAEAAVLVGTANWSGAASSTDADLVLTLPGTDPAAEQVSEVIEADIAGRAVPASALPTGLHAGEAVVSPFDSRTLLSDLLSTPGTRLLATSEELRDPGLLALLEQAASREPVEVAAPPSEATPAGAVRCSSSLYIHAKTFVLWQDGQPALAFLGSENLSTQSLNGNREIGVVVGPALASAIADAIAPVLE